MGAMMMRAAILVAAALVLSGSTTRAQQKKPSPDGHAAVEVGGKYAGATPTYVGGRWIEISYGRPIKRGRDLWGAGDAYGRALNAGAPVWRAGADNSTYLMAQVPMVINGTRIEPGGYSMFIDLKPDDWTLIVSSWQPQRFFNPGNRAELWGSYGYTADKDVVRMQMTLGTLPFSMEQLTWAFVDMSDTGGKMAIMWDTVMATVPFTIAQ